MAETIRVKVQCHVCGNKIEGSAKYGSGHFVQEGVPFDFVATGKIKTAAGGKQVKAEVTCVCPHCTVKNRYNI